MCRVQRIYRLVPGVVFLLSLLTYWFTAESGASYWDCPEYITGALLLEIGHPPGNPFWTLTHRVLSALPTPFSQVFVVNLCSGLFSALAAALGSVVALIMLRITFPAHSRFAAVLNCIAAASGALIFAWCDSTWFSAVEAEVYAMSLFLTILTLYLAIRARLALNASKRSRYLILISYLSGLSVGVHQLNLLVLPVVFLIIRFGLRRAGFGKLLLWFAAGCTAVVVMLKGTLHGTLWMASRAELVAVNVLGMGYHSGVVIWGAVVLLLSVATVICANKQKRGLTAILFTLTFALSGVPFIGGDNLSGIIIGAVIAIIGGVIVSRLIASSLRQGLTAIWCLPMILIGFSCYSVIMIRGAANPPMNQGAPSDIFSLSNYVDRKQYGARPLFYGRTPESRPLPVETLRVDASGDSVYSYTGVARTVGAPVYRRRVEKGGFSRRTGLLTDEDVQHNKRMEKRKGDAYIITDRYYDLIYTPELNTFLPRIVDGDEKSMATYPAWTGMTPGTMQRVAVSVAVDSTGKPLKHRHGDSGTATALRPTPMQHFNMFAGYQLGYMYFRYLMWNFGGRQNDIPSTGESEHGNFITGIDGIDSLMLGNQKKLPPELKDENKGRNVFYLIPFLLGIAGIIILARGGFKGKRICLLITLLFILTGPAIVFYLNQNLGEPRERDYSFLGSFYAFSLWITVGLRAIGGAETKHGQRKGIVLKARNVAAVVISAGLAGWMFAENLDDHDRHGRTITDDYARMILESAEPNSVLFVYGDNNTFPLWYAQDVLGMRRDVVIVNLSYLGADWYLAQLSSPRQDGGEPLRLVGTPADFAYGRYAVVRLGNDTTTVDAVAALRRMYQMPDTVEPVLNNLRLRFADGFVYDIMECLGKSPGGFITSRQLAMIDIIASSRSGELKRPVSWMKNIGKVHYAGLFDNTAEGLFTRTLSDTVSDNMPRLRWGGVDKGVYVDPISGRMLSFMRRNLIRCALRLNAEGKPDEALALTDSILKGMPFSASASDFMEYADTIADEETLLYELRIEAARTLGKDKIVNEGRKALKGVGQRRARMRNFMESLDPDDRMRLSPHTRQQL